MRWGEDGSDAVCHLRPLPQRTRLLGILLESLPQLTLPTNLTSYIVPVRIVACPHFDITQCFLGEAGLLTPKGVLTRDLEIFGVAFRGPMATPMVAFGPWLVSLETESEAGRRKVEGGRRNGAGKMT